MIKPTIGRMVWYTPAEAHDNRLDKDSPLSAQVVYVNDDETVNLAVFDQHGQHHAGITSVQLLQDNDKPKQTKQEDPTKRTYLAYAEWMPYQKSTADNKDVADLKSQLSTLTTQVSSLQAQVSALSTVKAASNPSTPPAPQVPPPAPQV